MRKFIRSKLTLMTVVIMLIAAAIPLVISTVHSQPTYAATPAAVTIPTMKLPWDRSLTTIALTGGPNGHYPDKTCTLENKSIMSGVDFGLPQNTNVLAVAAGRVIYAGYTDSQIRNEVRIDHGGGFVTEYWDLNSIDPSIVTGVSVAQGRLLGKSGYAPCPKCKNGISVHLRLEFRQYTSNPLQNTPLSAHGMAIDGYKIWTFLNTSSGQGYNFQGTMTRGMTIVKSQSECGVNGVKTWYSLNGSTILAIANGTGGFLTSTNLIQTDWPMLGFNAQHTRVNPYENVLNATSVSGLVQDWSITTPRGIGTEDAALSDGIIYFAATPALDAVDVTTGSLLWSKTIGSGPATSSPAVTNGIVYIGAFRNTSPYSSLYALNARTGALHWIVKGAGPFSSPTIVGNVLYVGGAQNTIFALNATTGAVIWLDKLSTVPNYITDSPAVVNGVVYIATNTGNTATMYALNASTGATLWSTPMGKQVENSSPAVANGLVYIADEDSLYAFDVVNGSIKWTSPSIINGIASPAVDNGIVYIGGNGLSAFNAITGSVIWTGNTNGAVISSATVANGVVYVGSYDHNLYAFNATNGTTLWTGATEGSIEYPSPVVANGVVYIASDDHKFYAFHLANTTP